MKPYKNLFLLLILTAITSCSGEAPKKTLESFLDATIMTANYYAAYDLLSEADKKTITKHEYISRFTQSDISLDVQNQLRSQNQYSIENIKVEGNKATATVQVTTPNVSTLIAKVMQKALANMFNSSFDADKEVSNLISKTNISELPKQTETEKYLLVRENGDWKVSLEFEVQTLLKEAKELEEKSKWLEASNRYVSALELNNDSIQAKTGLERSKEQTQKKLARAEYIKNIDLYEFEAKYIETWTDDKTVGVKFKLKNNGDKTLEAVRVTVYFEDAKGNTIFEESFNPLRGYDGKPLKPNYIWQLDKNKFYTIDSAPSEWKEGAAVAKIEDIEFLD